MKAASKSFADRLLIALLFLLLAERVLVFFQLGTEYFGYGDDESYIKSGLTFVETGVISLNSPYPSAMIMPGMPVLIGLLSIFFGSGTELVTAIRILWIVLGVFNAYIVYRTVNLICVDCRWAGLFGAAHFLLPNMAWMNQIVMTETPYMFFFTLCLYYTIQMSASDSRKYGILYVISFLLALMFRANILVMAFFTGGYLLCQKRLTVKKCLIFALSLLVFLIPWTVRNAHFFHAFVPLTYGTGHPLLLGTYQGEGYPADEEMDYDSYVDGVIKKQYASYFHEPVASDIGDSYEFQNYVSDSLVKEPQCVQYLRHQIYASIAKYRLSRWWQQNNVSLLKSYLYIKPRMMINWVWEWDEVLGIKIETLHRVYQINALFCAFTVILSLVLKEYRFTVFALGGLYLLSVYITAIAFVNDRYGSTLMSIRFILAGVGFALVWKALSGAGRLRQRGNT